MLDSCMSHAGIVSKWLSLSRRNFFERLVAPSGFLPQRRYPIPRVTPSARVQNTRGGKICTFRLKVPFILEMVRDRPIVTMER